ncbi:TRAPP trafficking subunit Trs65-domain-containing protein [Chlamydoabsidia padenii]|nr:TRAPP trafficking subunit Trs65-domain-containing protein [Chlamydoabsidia padenii]
MAATLSDVSSELLFNETKYQVLIPNLDYENIDSITYNDILTATDNRTFAFYDEQLRVYLYASIPHHITGTGVDISEAIRTFYNQLDIHVEASVIDTIPQQTTTSSHQRTVSKQLATMTSAPSSPQLNKRDQNRPGPETLPFYSHTYNSKDPEPMVFEHDQTHGCLFPVDIPIVYVKTRGGHPSLSININVAYRPLPSKSITNEEQLEDAEYDVDLFDTVDLLSGLGEDPSFLASGGPPSQHFIMENRLRQTNGNDGGRSAATSTLQLLTLRSHVRETIPLRQGLLVKMRTTNASTTDKTVMMSVELENPVDAACEFSVTKVEVQVSHAVVAPAFTQEIEIPVHLNTSDQMVYLYNVTLLEDGSTKPPQQPQRMFSTRRPLPQQPSSPSMHQEERIQPQRVTIHVYGHPIVNGIRGQSLRSKWNTMLDVTSMRHKRDDAPDPRFSSLLSSSSPSYLTRSQTSGATSVSVSPGARSVTSSSGQSLTEGMATTMKRPVINHQQQTRPKTTTMTTSASTPPDGARRAPELEVADGIVISFTAPEVVHVGKVFSLHIFIVNKSKHTRRFQVMIPNRKRQTATSDALMGSITPLPLLPMEQQAPIDPFMEENEFIRQYFENETHEADMISLENNVRLCPLGPSTSQAVDIRFIAVKEKLHTVDLIQLVDQDTGFVTNLRHVLEVFVEK